MSADRISHPLATASLTTIFCELCELVPAYRSTSCLPLSLNPRTVRRARTILIHFHKLDPLELDHPSGVNDVVSVPPQFSAETLQVVPSGEIHQACFLHFSQCSFTCTGVTRSSSLWATMRRVADVAEVWKTNTSPSATGGASGTVLTIGG